MARKKKRNYYYQSLKAELWKLYKDDKSYTYNSKKFSELASATYIRGDKQSVTKLKKRLKESETNLKGFSKLVEDELGQETISGARPFEYFEIDREIRKLQDDSTYDNFTLKTNFKGAYKDIVIKDLVNFDYAGSKFQDLVNTVDDFRKKNPAQSPPKKFMFKIDLVNKKIILFVGEESEPTNLKGAKREKPQPTKATVKAKTVSKEENLAKIKENKEQIKTKEKLILAMINNNMDKELISQTGKSMSELHKETEALIKENQEIDKALANSEYKKPKTKAKSKPKQKKGKGKR